MPPSENSVDLDQLASDETILSGSILFCRDEQFLAYISCFLNFFFKISVQFNSLQIQLFLSKYDLIPGFHTHDQTILIN